MSAEHDLWIYFSLNEYGFLDDELDALIRPLGGELLGAGTMLKEARRDVSYRFPNKRKAEKAKKKVLSAFPDLEVVIEDQEMVDGTR